MIFVTVGTHEQQFDRLIKYMDELSKNTDEEIVIQTGYSDYEPKCCVWKKMFGYREMEEKIDSARIVITHGGPSSFIAPLQKGKIPIVVPRQKKHDEHVNDHQLYFCNQVAEKMGNIIVVEDVENLKAIIENYDKTINLYDCDMKSNNKKFNEAIETIIKDLCG